MAATLPRLLRRDPEYRALRGLARLERAVAPLAELEQVAGLARELTDARYSALVVVDERDEVEGFVVSGFSLEQERRMKSAPQGHGPLGTMRQDGLAVRIDDLAAHAKAFGFPPRHPEMKTLLGVPIWTNATLRGALYVTDRQGGKRFRDEDEAALHVLARHAGAVIAERWY